MRDEPREMTIPDAIRVARKVSTPLISVSTADQFATIATIAASFQKRPPILQWDCARGFLAVNNEGKTALRAIMPKNDDELPGVTPGLNLVEALTMLVQAPESTLVFLLNAHRFFNEPAVIQGILNLREPFKETQRTLVLLGAIIQLPIELQQDVMTFDEALPSEDAIAAIIDTQVKAARSFAADVEEPDEETRRHAREALTGLSAFPAEQTVAMSLGSARRLDVDQLWARKRAFVAQTKGLRFDTTPETFADIGGLEAAKEHGIQVFTGRMPPRAVIRIDEIEKHMAGASGVIADSTGVSQDALGVILREMEDNAWRGVIAVGPPGGGKSIFSKTLGRTHGVPTLELDLGALKGSLVGQSEENIRTAMKVIKAISGQGAYFIATCNKLDVLPPELRRRFVHGIWFFDLPTVEELRPIWTINLVRYGIQGEDLEELLKLSVGWTGAEVRNVCRLAEETGRPVREMAGRIVPVSQSDPESIERLRKAAAGKFLSASYPGPYQHPADRADVHGPKTTRRFLES